MCISAIVSTQDCKSPDSCWTLSYVVEVPSLVPEPEYGVLGGTREKALGYRTSDTHRGYAITRRASTRPFMDSPHATVPMLQIIVLYH